jgi:hypothetical protein
MTEVQRIAIEVYELMKQEDAEVKRHLEAMKSLRIRLATIRSNC